MKPLFVLIAVFLLALIAIRIGAGIFDFRFAGRIAMSAMLLFTALGHFKFTEGMTHMLPHWFPEKRFIILATGFIEIAAAIGLQIPSWRAITAFLLIVFFVLILSSNIIAAANRLNYETGELNGPGPRYLWFRIPMQLFLMVWVYFSSVPGSAIHH